MGSKDKSLSSANGKLPTYNQRVFKSISYYSAVVVGIEFHKIHAGGLLPHINLECQIIAVLLVHYLAQQVVNLQAYGYCLPEANVKEAR